jgi:hypothetical protein
MSVAHVVDGGAGVDGMLRRSNLPRNSSYLVPCVFKAVRMIEALRESRTGLRVEDFRSMNGYSRSTIYRILRTLIACDYIIREAGGFYRLNHAVVTAAEETPRNRQDGNEIGRTPRPADRRIGFERWGVQFGADGRRMNTRCSAPQESLAAAK